MLCSNRIIPKKINIRVEHVKHSNCRLDFLKRVKANEEKKRIAKEQGVMGQYKREVSSVSLAFRHGWLQQCPLLAPSVCSPEMVWECVCSEWTWSMHYVGIPPYHFIPYYASAIHKHTHPQTIWGQWTDGAKSGYCCGYCVVIPSTPLGNIGPTVCWLTVNY